MKAQIVMSQKDFNIWSYILELEGTDHKVTCILSTDAKGDDIVTLEDKHMIDAYFRIRRARELSDA